MKNLIQSTEPKRVFGSTAKTTLTKLQKTVVLGVCALAPLTGMLAVAQAAPPPHAPAWGYRNKHTDRNRDYRDRDYRDRDYRNDRRNDRRSDRRDDYRDDRRYQQSFVGRVTNVRSAQSFDVQIGDKIYNVYLDSRLPRGLNVRDFVRIYGVRTDSNDIRNASVVILSNR